MGFIIFAIAVLVWFVVFAVVIRSTKRNLSEYVSIYPNQHDDEIQWEQVTVVARPKPKYSTED